LLHNYTDFILIPSLILLLRLFVFDKAYVEGKK
ncbi:hypothetical protein, partial [Staphylococcus epidermidis]